MPMPTLLDIAKQQSIPFLPDLVETCTKATPEVSTLPVMTIARTAYKTRMRTGLPPVGFRSVNQGVSPVKSEYRSELVETFIVDATVEVDDELLAEIDADIPDYLAQEQEGLFEAAMQAAGRQIFYGRDYSGNPRAEAGFPGFIDFVANQMTIDAGGRVDTTSVWVVCAGPAGNRPRVCLVMGNNGNIHALPAVDAVLTDENGRSFDGKRAPLRARMGLHAPAAEQCLVRIACLSDEAGCGLNDALLRRAFRLFPSGTRPTHIFGNKRVQEQLEAAREARAYNEWGQGDREALGFRGVPFHVTDSLRDDENTLLPLPENPQPKPQVA